MKKAANHAALSAGWNFDNSYSRLAPVFFTSQDPAKVREPRMVIFNHALAQTLGLSGAALHGEAGEAIFSGNAMPAGATPIAQAYAGHQFGHFNMLGDGRAILLGEQLAPDGGRFDIQLKGAGITPFSRRGDGRAALGPMLREYIISEAMHALGIPTTRSLAVVTTGEPVYRETVLQGAVLTRIAASHIRVGTFQYAAMLADKTAVKALADYTLQRHYAGLLAAENPYVALLDAVIDKQASLLAQWMQVGFIHGVMNTDNMSISGETIDYGPCAFMDAYDPGTVFSSIDQQGRYAFGNQPPIAQWNLARLAETLLPLLHEKQQTAVEIAQELLSGFAGKFRQYWLSGMRAKLGLVNAEENDTALIEELCMCMVRHRLDYTNTLRDLATDAIRQSAAWQQQDFKAWHNSWQQRLTRQPATPQAATDLMLQHNPFVIPRNHQVEAALEAAIAGNLSVMHKLLEVLAKPYDESTDNAPYRLPAPPSAQRYQTFCGT